jgi:hypothetical protein
MEPRTIHEQPAWLGAWLQLGLSDRSLRLTGTLMTLCALIRPGGKDSSSRTFMQAPGVSRDKRAGLQRLRGKHHVASMGNSVLPVFVSGSAGCWHGQRLVGDRRRRRVGH